MKPDLEARRRKRSHRWGMIAEMACIALLVLKGYSILTRRYRNPLGEIDIVAVRGGVLVFIEVKARTSREDALLSVTPDKQRRIAQAARGFLASRPGYAQHGLRFDVMVVTSSWRMYHLKDAWRT